jgi:transcription elongation factor GreA
MNFLIELLEEHIRSAGGSFTSEQLNRLDEQVRERLEEGASSETADVAYLAGILLEIGLPSTAVVVVQQAARQATSVLEYSSLENLQGRLAFESQDYDTALLHFDEAFQVLARDPRDSDSVTPSSASNQLQYCIAFNIALTHKRLRDLRGAREWRKRLDEIQHSSDARTTATAAISIALYWWDLALEDSPTAEDRVSNLRENATIVVDDLGPYHRDSRYSLLTLASASCELALAQGELDAAEDFVALMESMCQREAQFGHRGIFSEWMRLVFLSGYAEVAIARSQWGLLEEITEQLTALLRRWPSYRQDSAMLLGILKLNLAVIRVELARETTQPGTLIDTVQLLRLAIDDAGQSMSPLDPRTSIAATSHITSLIDALWEDPDLAIYGLAEKAEEAKALAIASLGDEHPGTVILDRHLQALTARITPESDELETSYVATLTRTESKTATGYFSRENYVSWGRAAQSIAQEALASRSGTSDDARLTRETYNQLQDELKRLSGLGRIDIAKNIEAAREEGDLREGGRYRAAKDAQAELERRISDLRQRISEIQRIMERAQAILPLRDDGVVGPGMTVTVRFVNDGGEVTFLLASQEDSGIPIDVYSPRSPLGAAIMGKRVGETASFSHPDGRVITVEILDVVPYVRE